MKSISIVLALALAALVAPSFAQKGGYNRAALANSQRSPVNQVRKAPAPAPAPPQVQQKTDEEEDESALLAAQRRRPQAPAPQQAAPAPAAPAPRPPAPRPAAPRPAPRPQAAYAPRPAAPAPRPAAPRPQPSYAPRPAAPAPSRPAPPSAAAASSGEEGGEEGHPAPEPYSFSYSVNDEESGSQLAREESQDASGNIVGFYTIQDAEGRSRRVEYTAGPEGFKANIVSNEEGIQNRDSADAHYEVSEPVAAAQGAKPQAAAGNRPY